MFQFFQKKAYFDFSKENKLVLDEIINYRPVGKVIEYGSLATSDSLRYLNSFQVKIMLRTKLRKRQMYCNSVDILNLWKLS